MSSEVPRGPTDAKAPGALAVSPASLHKSHALFPRTHLQLERYLCDEAASSSACPPSGPCVSMRDHGGSRLPRDRFVPVQVSEGGSASSSKRRHRVFSVECFSHVASLKDHTATWLLQLVSGALQPVSPSGLGRDGSRQPCPGAAGYCLRWAFSPSPDGITHPRPCAHDANATVRLFLGECVLLGTQYARVYTSRISLGI